MYSLGGIHFEYNIRYENCQKHYLGEKLLQSRVRLTFSNLIKNCPIFYFNETQTYHVINTRIIIEYTTYKIDTACLYDQLIIRRV